MPNVAKRLIIALLLTPLLATLLCITEAYSASPDQVLVLYNADWDQDLPGTEPGQDSLEVAKYYVERHTDPETGKKPRMLGLHCVHRGAKHLNEELLKEKSNDNRAGIVHIANKVKKTEMIKDSRFVEIRIEDQEDQADWGTLNISLKSELFHDIPVVRSGVPVQGIKVQVSPLDKEGTARRIAFNAYDIARREIQLIVEVRDKQGKKYKNLRETYYDFEDFIPSRTGPDGIRDNQHYLDDVETQVKAFLEDSQNALADGTRLKDHILYTVVCYGLPRVVEAPYGIARGITENLKNHGDLASLEERLALLYYNIDQVMDFRIGAFRIQTEETFRPYLIRTGLCRPIAGNRVNPHIHPWAFKKKRELTGEWPEVPHFTSCWRKKPENLNKFLYVVTRIDGDHPSQAIAQIDSAIYASKYLTPEIGKPEGNTGTSKKVKKKSCNSPIIAQDFLRNLGYKHVAISRYPGGRLQFNRLDPHPPFFNEESVYLPGGIAHVVKSNNDWTYAKPLQAMVSRGVTFTGGAGLVWGGAPHTTSHSWWDEDVLFHYLFTAYDLGECILMSRIFLGWITSLVGDPLYKPDQEVTRPDTQAPRPASKPRIQVVPGALRDAARLSVPLNVNISHPEVAQICVFYWKEDEAPQVARSNLFSSKPSVWMAELDPNMTYNYKYDLIDPYGNVYQSENHLTFQTTNRKPEKRITYRCNEKQARFSSLILEASVDEKKKRCLNLNHGEMELSFQLTSKPEGSLNLIKGREFSLKLAGRDKRLYFHTGGAEAHSEPKNWNSGEDYKILLKWSKWPAIRAIYVMNENNWELTALCNKPVWSLKNKHGRIQFAPNNKPIKWKNIQIFSDIDPCTRSINCLSYNFAKHFESLVAE